MLSPNLNHNNVIQTHKRLQKWPPFFGVDPTVKSVMGDLELHNNGQDVSVPTPLEYSAPFWHPWYSRFARRKVAGLRRPEIVVAVEGADSPPLVLPYPPADEEKYIYVQSRRIPLYISGTFAFLALSVGTWFFSLISPEFYWYVRCSQIMR